MLSQETHYDTLEQGTKAIEPQKEERFLRDAAGNRTEEYRNPVWHNLLLPGPLPDRESGIHYNLFRYYDTVAGRYTQMDLIGLAGGLNIYSYVGDPLVWVDVLGLMCTLTIPKAKWGERINFLLRKWTCLSKV
ncbi:RHS repeat-associated core domain-containing protein [Cronobacter dublinensis]